MSRLRDGETQPAALSAAILWSVSVGHFREPEVWGNGSARCGRSGHETEQFALFRPVEWQIAQFLQPGCGQVDGLLAKQYFLDNIGCQRSKLNCSAELGRVGALQPCQFTCGGSFASSQSSESPVCSRDQPDQRRADLGVAGVGIIQNQTRRSASPAQRHRDVEGAEKAKPKHARENPTPGLRVE